MSNDNPVAIITGSARRIGATIAKTLHANHYNVVIHYRHSQQAATELCDLLNQERANSAIIVQGDLAKFVDLKMIIGTAAQQWQRIDVLINNASEFFSTPLTSTSLDQWQTLLDTNLKAPYFLAQFAYPHLKKAHGSIINIADIHGDKPLKEYPVYSMTKAGLIMQTQALAKDLGPEIRVNAISPGMTLWPENQNALSNKEKERLLAKTALHRLGSPNDIAKAILFLCEQQSITGQVINVDCGRSL